MMMKEEEELVGMKLYSLPHLIRGGGVLMKEKEKEEEKKKEEKKKKEEEEEEEEEEDDDDDIITLCDPSECKGVRVTHPLHEEESKEVKLPHSITHHPLTHLFTDSLTD